MPARSPAGSFARATRWSCCRARAARPSPGSTPSRGRSRKRSRRCPWRCGSPPATASGAGIDTSEGRVKEASPPMSVALRLADDIDVGRGSMIVRTQNQPTVSGRFECLMCWMSEQPLSSTRRYIVKHTTRTAMVAKAEVRYRIDVETLRREEGASALGLNDLARVHLELSAPLVFDSYRRNRVTGSLIVIDEATNDTVAAGVILDTEVEVASATPVSERSPNVKWQGSRVTRERRWSELGHGGATLWFTGLPGAGKSTVAAAVEERLIA